LVGEWSSFEVALLEGIEPASLLNMCVDGDAGYAPTETWTNSDGMACSSTTEYQTSCQLQ